MPIVASSTRDEERAAGQRRVVAEADVGLEGEQRHEMRGPHDRAGGEAGEEQPAAAALAVHLARLREEEERDEASERADRGREQNELRIVALQNLVAGEEHGGPLKNAISFPGRIDAKAVKTRLGGRLNKVFRGVLNGAADALYRLPVARRGRAP